MLVLPYQSKMFSQLLFIPLKLATLFFPIFSSKFFVPRFQSVQIRPRSGKTTLRFSFRSAVHVSNNRVKRRPRSPRYCPLIAIDNDEQSASSRYSRSVIRTKTSRGAVAFKERSPAHRRWTFSTRRFFSLVDVGKETRLDRQLRFFHRENESRIVLRNWFVWKWFIRRIVLAGIGFIADYLCRDELLQPSSICTIVEKWELRSLMYRDVHYERLKL